MWSSSIDFSQLQDRGRWQVEFFCSPKGEDLDTAGLTSIRQLVRERKESLDPASLGDTEINYIGLEHVHSLTGELVGFTPRSAREVKSRSKVFRDGDVLFGRLRPNLNKVWLARSSVPEGLCSTEFFVLQALPTKIKPIILRYLLSSHYVHRHAARLQTGTALPRMHLDDLLDIRVPVPTMEAQEELEALLNEEFDELVDLRRKLATLPETILNRFLQRVEADAA